MKLNLWIAALSLSLFASCSPNKSSDPAPSGSTGTTGTTGTTGSVKTAPPAGIYYIGSRANAIEPKDFRATIWKDNVATLLSNYYSNALAIAVQDTSIYISGNEKVTGKNLAACYWKDNKIVKLRDGTENYSSGNAIAVQGNDVYVAGVLWENLTSVQKAVYWRNGVMTTLASPGTGNYVTGIAVKGADVYVCGYYTNANFEAIACYWKNGTINTFNDNSHQSAAYGITIADNGDVYIVGMRQGTANPRTPSFTRIPTFWKNGIAQALPTNGVTTAVAQAITVKGNDVYIAGTDLNNSGPSGVYWKNGNAVYINSLTYVTSIFVSGNEVYVTGDRKVDTNNTYGVLWISGNIYQQYAYGVVAAVYVIK